MTLDMIAPKMRSQSEAECEGFAFFIGIPTGNSGYFWQYPGVDVSEPNLRGLRRRASCVLPMMRASCVGPSPLSILASSAPRRPLIGIDPSLQQQRGSSGLGRVTGQPVGVFLAPFAPPHRISSHLLCFLSLLTFTLPPKIVGGRKILTSSRQEVK